MIMHSDIEAAFVLKSFLNNFDNDISDVLYNAISVAIDKLVLNDTEDRFIHVTQVEDSKLEKMFQEYTHKANKIINILQDKAETDASNEALIRQSIADEVEKKMDELHCCPNEREIYLGIIKNEATHYPLHCDSDCPYTYCPSNNRRITR